MNPPEVRALSARTHADCRPRCEAAMAIYQHATLDRDKALAERIGETYDAWQTSRSSE